MPKYTYRCRECEYQFETRHSIRDRLFDCEECGVMECLVRIPQLVNKAAENNKDGQLVNQFIEENKEVLRQQKQEASRKTWDK